MKAHTANLINALVLVGFGLWAWFGSAEPSKTALIPVGFGVVLVFLHPGVKKEDKIIAHVAVLLTLVIFVALFKPLSGAAGRGDGLAVFRVAAMMATSLLALFFFVKSFVDVRRARRQKAQQSGA